MGGGLFHHCKVTESNRSNRVGVIYYSELAESVHYLTNATSMGMCHLQPFVIDAKVEAQPLANPTTATIAFCT